MSSRYAAARPKRAGEAFARQHHGERDGGNGNGSGSDDEEAAGEGSTSKKVRFDMRNPSALAPEAREDDEVLDADVIGVGAAATKRGAVNIDGYDSDSDNDAFNDRAELRTKKTRKSGKGGGGEPDVNLLDQLDSYDKRLKGEDDTKEDEDDDEDDDMFGDDDGDEDEEGAKKGDAKDAEGDGSKRKRKEVRFLRFADIKGQEDESRSRSKMRLDEGRGGDGNTMGDESDSSTSDEDEAALEIQEEAVDEEVGAGGLKRHAPKIDAFNMRSEREEGAFDESGNFIRKAADPDALHDRWLDGVSKREMRKAAAAHERRVAEVRQQRRDADNIITADLFAALITRLKRGETSLEALARLGKGLAAAKVPKAKKIPQWRLKKQQQKQGDQMDVDKDESQQNQQQQQQNQKQNTATQDPELAKRKADIDAITDAADNLLNRDYADIYDLERERLVREYRAETGEAWVDPPRAETPEADDNMNGGDKKPTTWQFRWTDGRDGGTIQGPFDGPTMKAWQDAGYFGEGVEFREMGEGDDNWSRVATFV